MALKSFDIRSKALTVKEDMTVIILNPKIVDKKKKIDSVPNFRKVTQFRLCLLEAQVQIVPSSYY